MAKRKLKEKEILEALETEGFHKVSSVQKKSGWYKKASKRPACLTAKSHKIQVS
jgi:hypothetical protein